MQNNKKDEEDISAYYPDGDAENMEKDDLQEEFYSKNQKKKNKIKKKNARLTKSQRIGLCDSENLHSDKTYFAGPNHPALGEMIIGEVFYKNLRRAMEKMENTDSITVCVPCGAVSAAVGQKKRNKIRLADEYGVRRIKFVERCTVCRTAAAAGCS